VEIPVLTSALQSPRQLIASRLVHTIAHHPKQITALLAAVLTLGGGAAYAVAALAPDASLLPIRQVLEAVQPLPLQAQQLALDAHSFQLFRSETSRSSDTALTVLQRLGINDAAAVTFLRNDPNFRTAVLNRPGRTVLAEASEGQALLKLSARWVSDESGNFNRLVIEKTASGFSSRVETAPLVANARLGSGTIRSSLFAATDDAKIPDSVAVQLATIFDGDIDFHRALRKGDRFSVVYEALEADGEPMRAGRVLSTEFVNNGKTFQATWFQEPGLTAAGQAHKGAYYNFEGQSLRKAYLASPLEFSRVSSGFKMRFHPILQTWRAHLGVDYAAPTGTAVRAVGDGTVEFAGVQGGYGNVVFIKHRNNDATVYAHLSRIAVTKGQAISQGQNIGAVGATGWATGPHLHFEFRVNGMHIDPMTLASRADTVPVSAAARAAFAQSAAVMKQNLVAAATVVQASAQ
jgi:murein DD-endopeptidase MepM/ murein hydrolase activator NlpD